MPGIILIHTSVKLVTAGDPQVLILLVILIHTSVKLVTEEQEERDFYACYFNPHEREARDRLSEMAIEVVALF